MPDLPLYERVHEWSVRKPDHLLTISPPDRKVAERQAIQYRTWLRQAHRFVFEPDFTASLAQMSRDLRRLPLWVQLARLPYDRVWLEWNVGDINRAQQAHLISGFDETLDGRDEPVGFLLVRDPRSKTKWAAVQFVLVDGVVMPGMLTFVFDPEGSAIEPVRGGFGVPTLSMDPILRGAVESGIETMVMLATRSEDGQHIAVPQLDWYVHRCAATIEPLWRTVLGHPNFSGDKTNAELRRHMLQALTDEAGTLRKLVTALALINDVPVLGRAEVKRGGMRPVRLKQLPYLGHTSITLELPKRAHPVRTLQRYLNRAAVDRARMRAHEVRGHFRRVSRKAAGIVCRHAAMEVTDGVGVCHRCGETVRWIPAFQRGDAGLGWVQKTEYRLRSAD